MSEQQMISDSDMNDLILDITELELQFVEQTTDSGRADIQNQIDKLKERLLKDYGIAYNTL